MFCLPWTPRSGSVLLLSLLAGGSLGFAQQNPLPEAVTKAWAPGKPNNDVRITRFPGSWLDQSIVPTYTGEIEGMLAYPIPGLRVPGHLLGERDSSAKRLEVDREFLAQLDPSQEHRVGMPLPEGGHLELILSRCEWRNAVSYSWVGQIAGVANSDVILVVELEAVRVVVRNHNAYGRILQIRFHPDGHILSEFDGMNVTNCEGPLTLDTGPQDQTGQSTAPTHPLGPGEWDDDEVGAQGSLSFASAGDPTNVIDVLVVASDEARSGVYFGSAAAFLADARAAIVDANLRVSGSNGAWQYRLSAAPFDLISGYSEQAASGNMDRDLYELTGVSGQLVSGYFCVDTITDAIQNQRDTYRSDIVCLVTQNGTGVGWAPNTLATTGVSSSNFVSSAAYLIAVGTFAHEAGHNMGGCHNANASAPSCNLGINGKERGIERFCDLTDIIISEDREFYTTMAYRVRTDVPSERLAYYSVQGLYVVYDGTFETCTVPMWDNNAQVMTTFELTRPIVSNNFLGSLQVYAAANAGSSGNGTFVDPFGTIQSASQAVLGGASKGVVKAHPGTYDEVSGTPLTLSNPCTIDTTGGWVILE